MSTYTASDLCRQLREFAAELGHTPTTTELRSADELPSFATYQRRFGSWTDALQAAGLDQEQQETTVAMSDETLLDQLREFAAEHGHPPSWTDVATAETDLPSPTTYSRRFGDWTTALQEAGLDPAETRSERPTCYSREELLDRLHEFTERCGYIPTVHELNEADDMPSQSPYLSRFGSWTNALEEAGMTPEQAQLSRTLADSTP